jgi:hypothetical protein
MVVASFRALAQQLLDSLMECSTLWRVKALSALNLNSNTFFFFLLSPRFLAMFFS